MFKHVVHGYDIECATLKIFGGSAMDFDPGSLLNPPADGRREIASHRLETVPASFFEEATAAHADLKQSALSDISPNRPEIPSILTTFQHSGPKRLIPLILASECLFVQPFRLAGQEDGRVDYKAT